MAGRRTANVFVIPLVAVLAGRRILRWRSGREATRLIVVPVPVVLGAAFPGRRVVGFAGGALGNTAFLLVKPEFVGMTVRVASGHGWDDHGEKSKRNENARNKSHFETKVGKRETGGVCWGAPSLCPLAL